MTLVKISRQEFLIELIGTIRKNIVYEPQSSRCFVVATQTKMLTHCFQSVQTVLPKNYKNSYRSTLNTCPALALGNSSFQK